MESFDFSPRRWTIAPLIIGSCLGLASCAPTGTQLASNEPGVCGGDFGMLEQMEYEYRGNAMPVPTEVYDHC